ncbi:hypothetical protein H8N03_16710 [Ramlibacter sp. USB13]|uniref:Uncharacterized protein n=1 Tax=Ramlibacter cellulosilyticus TaxID=2764187 RepID=A0A923MRP6_9BURK|nr:hypothetical protein [Ramlibacter cellulosilyticus]MBC5784592.1 hypothetical protein [Ramlibacter cellulosilyticus]
MNDPSRAPLPRLRRVLVLHDLHPDADNAAWRGALVVRPHDGWMRLLHVSRLRDPGSARERLAPLAWRVQEHLQLGVLTHAFRGSLSGELKRAAEDADLVVMRAASGFDAATGLHPLRVAQLANRPTLVVRTPATVPYRRILVGALHESDDGRALATASAMTDGREAPATALLQSAAALLERERTLLPDVVAVPCARQPSLARRFLALTRADTLLLPSPLPGPDEVTAGLAGGALAPGLLLSQRDLPLAGENA